MGRPGDKPPGGSKYGGVGPPAAIIDTWLEITRGLPESFKVELSNGCAMSSVPLR